MALIRCPECGKEISESAKACPNCGKPIVRSATPIYGPGASNAAQNMGNSAYAPQKKKNPLIVVLAVVGVIVVIAIIGKLFGTVEDDPGATTPPSEEASASASATVSDKPADAVVVDYVEIWENYDKSIHDDMIVKMYGQISYISSNGFNVTEGLDGITGMITITLADKSTLDGLSVGDDVLFVGRIDGKTLGYLYIKDATVEETGQSVTDMIASQKSDREAKRQAAFEEQQQAEAVEREAFIAQCEEVDWTELARNPDNYIGKKISVTGEIAQIMSGGLFAKGGYRLYEDYDWQMDTYLKHEWYIFYELPEGSPRILDDDIITFYGEYNGVEVVTRALTGTKDYIPSLAAKYFILN